MQKNIEDKLKELNNKVRFISCVISGELKIGLRTDEELLQDIIAKGFDRLPKEGQTMPGVNEEYESNPDAIDFAYLTNIYVCCLNEEYLHILVELTKRTEAELARKDTPTASAVLTDNHETADRTIAVSSQKLRAHRSIQKRAKDDRTTAASSQAQSALKGVKKRVKESSNTSVLIAPLKDASKAS